MRAAHCLYPRRRAVRIVARALLRLLHDVKSSSDQLIARVTSDAAAVVMVTREQDAGRDHQPAIEFLTDRKLPLRRCLRPIHLAKSRRPSVTLWAISVAVTTAAD